MAEVIRFINLASTAGGDGTTNNTTGATRAYATVSEWESAEQTDLVSAGDYHHVFLDGGESLEQLVVAGWTTNDTDNYIIIEVAANSRSDGTFGSGFRLKTTAGGAQVYQMQQAGTITIGLECVGTGNNVDGCRYSTTGGIFLFCLFQGAAANGAGYSSSDNDGGMLFGCLVADTGDGLFAGNADAIKLFNNTAINCGVGIERQGTSGTAATIANNAVFGSATNDYVVPQSLAAASRNNASEDLTAVGSSPLTGLVSGDFTNIGAGDYSIPDNSSALYNAGADISSDVSAFDRTDFTIPLEDIIGTARPQGGDWDIGAFELIVSSGITITGATANYNYSGITGDIELTGEIIVTGGTANYDYDGITGTIDLTGEVIVTGATANYDYNGITGTIELGAEIIVTGQTANYNYSGIDGEVELTGLITVIGQTANYDYDGIAGDIILQGSIIVTGSTANYDYNALNGTIILQGPLTLNPRNIIRVKRKSNTIIVKRKSNIVRVR